MTRLAALLACLLLAAPARADDRGGNVAAYAAAIRWADLRDREKRIEGYCASACTMWASYERTCFEPGTVLGFHGARLRLIDEDGSSRMSAAMEALMVRHYGPRTKAWFREHAADSTRIVRLPVERLVRWGEARLCRD